MHMGQTALDVPPALGAASVPGVPLWRLKLKLRRVSTLQNPLVTRSACEVFGQRMVSEVIGPPAPQIVPESLEKFHKNQSLRLSDLREITATVVDSAMLQWWLRGLSEISEKRLLNRQLGLEFVRPRCTGPEKDFVLAALVQNCFAFQNNGLVDV